mgnify:FL=1
MALTITEIPFVGYPVSDMNRARDFYERVLGLEPGDIDHEIKEMPGKYWVEYEIGAQTLAISNAWEPSGQSGPSVAFEVEDFQESVNHLKKEGVKILAECIETSVCRMALIEDLDGNGITIHKRK